RPPPSSGPVAGPRRRRRRRLEIAGRAPRTPRPPRWVPRSPLARAFRSRPYYARARCSSHPISAPAALSATRERTEPYRFRLDQKASVLAELDAAWPSLVTLTPV